MKPLFWTEPAASDLEAIHDYIGRDSPTYAKAFVEDLFLAVERVPQFPRSGRVVPELREDKVREIVVGSYRVMYEIGRDAIWVLAIVHSARQFRDPRR